MVNIQPYKNNIEKKDIAELEEQLKLKLPQEYINFLLKYNAGKPESNIVILQDSNIPSFSVTSFFGINVEDHNEINIQFKSLTKRIPLGSVPIARTEGGNVICLNLNVEGYGTVLLWDHEKELLHGHNIVVGDLALISKSFNGFMDLINPYNPDDEDLSSYEVKEAWIDPDFLKELNKGN